MRRPTRFEAVLVTCSGALVLALLAMAVVSAQTFARIAQTINTHVRAVQCR